MDCPKEEMVSFYIQDGLTEEQRLSFEAHLLDCEQCQQRYFEGISVNPHQECQIEVTEVVMDQILMQRKRERRFLIQNYMIAASFTLLFVGIGVFSKIPYWVVGYKGLLMKLTSAVILGN